MSDITQERKAELKESFLKELEDNTQIKEDKKTPDKIWVAWVSTGSRTSHLCAWHETPSLNGWSEYIRADKSVPISELKKLIDEWEKQADKYSISQQTEASMLDNCGAELYNLIDKEGK